MFNKSSCSDVKNDFDQTSSIAYIYIIIYNSPWKSEGLPSLKNLIVG